MQYFWFWCISNIMTSQFVFQIKLYYNYCIVITTGILKGPVVLESTIVEEDSDSPIMAWTADCPVQDSSDMSPWPFIRAIAALIDDRVEPQLS